jgi:CDP-diacylglycerol--serine O-phosphatidyltransferase
MVTLLALGAGLTGIRMAIEGRFDMALYAILVAAFLDGVDGRLARLLKGTSRFGAELDSLSDFVNFGVAPAVILYIWCLSAIKSLGWLAVLIYAMAAALRLARFNIMLEQENRPTWTSDFFQGVPSPAGALLALLPMYMSFQGLPTQYAPSLVALYVMGIGALMVSNVPTFSGKRLGLRIPRERVLLILIAVVLVFALVVNHTWEALTLLSLMYLASLPVAWRVHKRLLSSSVTPSPNP